MRAQRLFCGKYYSQSRGDTLSKLMREEDNEKARTLSKTPAVTRWPQRRDRNFREKEGSPLEGTRFCQNRATKVSKGRRRTRLQVLQSPRTWGGAVRFEGGSRKKAERTRAALLCLSCGFLIREPQAAAIRQAVCASDVASHARRTCCAIRTRQREEEPEGERERTSLGRTAIPTPVQHLRVHLAQPTAADQAGTHPMCQIGGEGREGATKRQRKYRWGRHTH